MKVKNQYLKILECFLRSIKITGQSSTVISWSAKHLEVVLAGAKVLLEKEISISIKLVSRWKHKVL